MPLCDYIVYDKREEQTLQNFTSKNKVLIFLLNLVFTKLTFY